jgi:hypothetical protein
LGTLSVLTNLHKVLLGRRALHGRAWRRTRSPLGPSSAYRYLTLYYNRSPNNSATFRRWRARAHQHEERLRRRRTPPCKHDGARAVEAQRARRVADQRHESTCGHHTDGRRAPFPQEEPLAAAGELCASRRRAAPAWRMAGDVASFTTRSALGASITFTAAMRQPLRDFRPGLDRRHAPGSADARSATPTSCGNVVSAFSMSLN